MATVDITFGDGFYATMKCDDLRALELFVDKYRPVLGDELARDFFSIPEDSGDGVGVIMCLEDQSISSSDSDERSAIVLELVGRTAGGAELPVGWLRGESRFREEFFADWAEICDLQISFRVEVVGFDEYWNIYQHLTPRGWFIDCANLYEWDGEDYQMTEAREPSADGSERVTNEVDLDDLYRLATAAGEAVDTEDEQMPELDFRDHVEGDLDLSHLTAPAGLVLPKKMKGNLYLHGLTTSQSLKLPEEVEGHVFLDGLTSAVGLTLPQRITGGRYHGGLSLDGLTTTEGLALPEDLRGGLSLNGLTSALGLELPQHLEGGLHLNSLTNVEGLVLPERIGGGLSLNGLTDAHALTLPEHIGGDLSLDGLESVEGLVMPDEIGGSLSMSSLEQAEGLSLPNRVGGDVHLPELDLPSSAGLRLPIEVGGCIQVRRATRRVFEEFALTVDQSIQRGAYELIGADSRFSLPNCEVSELSADQLLWSEDPVTVLRAINDPSCTDEGLLGWLDESPIGKIGNTGLDWFSGSPVDETILLSVMAHKCQDAEECIRSWRHDAPEDDSGLMYLAILANPNCPESFASLVSEYEPGSTELLPDTLLSLLRQAGRLVGDPGLVVDPANLHEVKAFARTYLSRRIQDQLAGGGRNAARSPGAGDLPDDIDTILGSLDRVGSDGEVRRSVRDLAGAPGSDSVQLLQKRDLLKGLWRVVGARLYTGSFEIELESEEAEAIDEVGLGGLDVLEELAGGRVRAVVEAEVYIFTSFREDFLSKFDVDDLDSGEVFTCIELEDWINERVRGLVTLLNEAVVLEGNHLHPELGDNPFDNPRTIYLGLDIPSFRLVDIDPTWTAAHFRLDDAPLASFVDEIESPPTV